MLLYADGGVPLLSVCIPVGHDVENLAIHASVDNSRTVRCCSCCSSTHMTIDAKLQLDTSCDDHDKWGSSSGFSVTDRRLVRTFYDLMESAQVAFKWSPAITICCSLLVQAFVAWHLKDCELCE